MEQLHAGCFLYYEKRIVKREILELFYYNTILIIKKDLVNH